MEIKQVSKKYSNSESLLGKHYKALMEQMSDDTKDVDEWFESMRVVLEGGATINFNAIPDDSKLVMNSIRYPPHTGRNLPPAHNPNLRCTTTPMESKMKSFKTEAYKGQVYQIGGVYLARDTVDSEDTWTPIRLMRIDHKSKYPFRGSSENGYGYKCITAVQPHQFTGTITPAPIELVDGAAYMFGCGNRLNAVGVYDARGERFYHLRGMYFGLEDCTNIRPMAVAENGKSHE